MNPTPPRTTEQPGAVKARGLRAAQIAISDMIAESRAACQPYGPRQGRKLAWWEGHFQGLVAAEAMLALADFPTVPENAQSIEEILRAASVTVTGSAQEAGK